MKKMMFALLTMAIVLSLLATAKTDREVIDSIESKLSQKLKDDADLNRKIDTIMTSKAISMPQLSMHGTEYVTGENGKAFLQLTADGSPVENASCMLTVFYPNATLFLKDAAMIFLPNSNGIYYYPQIIPQENGLYMLSARCYYSSNNYAFNNPDHFPNIIALANVTVISAASTEGSFFAVNSPLDGLYVRQHATPSLLGIRETNITMEWDTKLSGKNLTNITNMQILFMAQAQAADVQTRFRIFNFSKGDFGDYLPNIISSYIGTATSTNPDEIDDFVSNTLEFPQGNSELQKDGIVRVNIESRSGSNQFWLWYNWIELEINSYASQIQFMRGSSEWHVSNSTEELIKAVNNSLAYGQNLLGLGIVNMPQRVWNYSDRTLTAFLFNVTLNSSSGSFGNDDDSPPVIIPLSPSNGSEQQNPITFSFSVSDSSFPLSCTILANNTPLSSETISTNGTLSRTVSIDEGVYSWTAACSDSQGNVGYGQPNIFSALAAAPILASGVCPQSLPGVMLLGLLLIASFGVMMFARYIRNGLTGFIGAIMLLMCVPFLFGCSFIIGSMLFMASIFMMSYFVLKGMSGKW